MKPHEKNKHTFAQDITNILVKYRCIDASEAKAMQEAFAQSAHDQFDDFLLEEGLVEKEYLLKALGDYYKLPVIDVVGQFFDHELVCGFHKDFMLRNAFIPLEVDGDELVIIAANPALEGLAAAIMKVTDYEILFMVGLRLDICDAVKEFYDKAVTEDIPQDEDIHKEHLLRNEAEELEEAGNIIINPKDEE